jgi:hypothetical protein
VTTTTDILYRDIQRLKGLAGPLQQKIRWLLGGTQVAEPGAVIDVNVGSGLSALVTAAPDSAARAGQKMITLSATGGGSVNSVTAGDATITVGGTASDPTVAVTSGMFDAYGDAAAAQTAAEAYTDALAATLGTAATHNVPVSGDASSTEVVLGNDSRLGGGVDYTEAGIVVSFGSIDGTEILVGAPASETRSMSPAEYDYSVGTSDTWQLWVSPTPTTGTFTLDVRKRAFGNTLPDISDSICASALPSLSGNSTDFTASGSTSTWTDAPIARGDMVSVVPTVNTAGVTWFALFIPARRNF